MLVRTKKNLKCFQLGKNNTASDEYLRKETLEKSIETLA